MANKKILSIDIDDEKFKAFYEQWKEFNVDLEHMPEGWKELSEEAARSHEVIAAAAGALIENLAQASTHAKDLVEHLKKAGDAQKDFKSAGTDSEITLKKMGKEAKEFANTIFGIGKFLLKLGVLGVGTVAGGLFGFDKLAEGAVGTQRQARGLGLTTGQLRAFQTDLGARYIDESTLGAVADARSDLTKQWALRRATGMSQGEIDQTDVGTLAAQLALRAHDWWASTPANQHNAQFLQATGFTQAGLSLDQVRQFGNTDRVELTRALAQYQHDSKSLNVSDHNTDALYAFMRDLKLAGSDLETYFSNKLAVLGPHLGDFITRLEVDSKMLLDEVLTPANLKKAEDAIDSFTKYLGSGEFTKNLEDAGEYIKEFADTTASVIAFLKKEFPGAEALQTAKDVMDDPLGGSHKDPKDKNAVDHVLDFMNNSKKKYDSLWHSFTGSSFGMDLGAQNPIAAFLFSNAYASTGYTAADSSNRQKNFIDRAKADALFGKLENVKNLPPGLLDALTFRESHFDANALSKAGAQGLMQLMPSVSRNLGVQDPFNWIQSAMGGATLLEQLQSRYKGDLAKEIAAWNWRPDALDKDIKANGSNWLAHAPQETQNLVANVLRSVQKKNSMNVNITVTSKIGADVAVQTNAAASG